MRHWIGCLIERLGQRIMRFGFRMKTPQMPEWQLRPGYDPDKDLE